MDKVDVLSRKQIDVEAEKFLMKYRPNALSKPTKLDLESLIENDLGLEIDYQNLDPEHQILGATIFRDGYMDVYSEGKKESKMFSKNTMVFDIKLSEDYKQEGRFLFTLAHEIGHWVLHRKHFFIDDGQASLFTMLEEKEEEKFIVCAKRDENAMLCVKRKTPEEWIEWQADNFASSLLMPKAIFKLTYEELKNKKLSEELILKELSSIFGASKKACEIRINILYNRNTQCENQLILS